MNKKRADDTIPIRQPWETCKAARAAPYSSGYRPQCGLLGGHNGIGPNSALSIGVAIATYAQAKPTIRINILTARFMVFSLRCEVPGSGTSRWRHYTDRAQTVQAFLNAVAHAPAEQRVKETGP